jgi:lipoate-protein ligase B
VENEPIGSRLPKADYVGYLRKLEQVLIDALVKIGVVAFQQPGLTGVWVNGSTRASSRVVSNELKASRSPDRASISKIAAIGVKVDARGISRHGFALNVDPDMSYWNGIIGCGLSGYRVASLGECVVPAPSMERVAGAVIESFGDVFGYTMVEPLDKSIRM